MQKRTKRYLTIAFGMLLLFLIAPRATTVRSSEGGQTLYLPLVALSGWKEVGQGAASAGGISNTVGASTTASIAVDPTGGPFVAWANDHGGSYDIYVRRWDGFDWIEVGLGSASGGGISNNPWDSTDPSIAIAPDGTPYIAWSHFNGGDREIYVKRWNGTGWEEVGFGSASVGGISNDLWASNRPSIAIAPDGTPYVAWNNEYVNGHYIYVRLWNGVAWEEVGAGSASVEGIEEISEGGRPSIAIAPDGTVYMAWAGEQIFVLGWNGSEWEEVGLNSASDGGISNNPTVSEDPVIAVGPDGAPIVAWDNYLFTGPINTSQIYVRRWDGNEWKEIGVASATDSGISATYGYNFYASIAIGPEGVPYIAWEQYTQGEIYVRRWNGNSWEEVGWRSATGGGISGNAGVSSLPSIAIGLDGIPFIAWEDDTSGSREIYVRTFTD